MSLLISSFPLTSGLSKVRPFRTFPSKPARGAFSPLDDKSLNSFRPFRLDNALVSSGCVPFLFEVKCCGDTPTPSFCRSSESNGARVKAAISGVRGSISWPEAEGDSSDIDGI
uniref:Uncharacterized protein n=1 Tax=Arundo donax TaxID=35708 RepID=A0A0A9FQR5_ARUDO